MLYRIIKKNQNKIFWTIGQFEYKYFGGSDVVNKLLVGIYICVHFQMNVKSSEELIPKALSIA